MIKRIQVEKRTDIEELTYNYIVEAHDGWIIEGICFDYSIMNALKMAIETINGRKDD